MRTFDDIMNDPKNHIKLKMAPGERDVVVHCDDCQQVTW